MTPGEAFDAPGFLRLSYATSMQRARARVAADARVSRQPRRPSVPLPSDFLDALRRDRSAPRTSAPTRPRSSSYGVDALKRGHRAGRRRHARRRRGGGVGGAAVRGAADPARSARRRDRLYGRRRAGPRRRRPVAGADEPHPRNRRRESRRRRRAERHHRRSSRKRSSASGCSIPRIQLRSRQSVVGGNVAECAGGPRAFKYGTTKQYVLGLQAVLPNGEIVSSRRQGREERRRLRPDAPARRVRRDAGDHHAHHPAAGAETAGAVDPARDVPHDRRTPCRPSAT